MRSSRILIWELCIFMDLFCDFELLKSFVIDVYLEILLNILQKIIMVSDCHNKSQLAIHFRKFSFLLENCIIIFMKVCPYPFEIYLDLIYWFTIFNIIFYILNINSPFICQLLLIHSSEVNDIIRFREKILLFFALNHSRKLKLCQCLKFLIFFCLHFRN